MNYLDSHKIGQERMQQFINEAEEMRRARQLGIAEPKSNLMLQIRAFLVKTFTLSIR